MIQTTSSGVSFRQAGGGVVLERLAHQLADAERQAQEHALGQFAQRGVAPPDRRVTLREHRRDRVHTVPPAPARGRFRAHRLLVTAREQAGNRVKRRATVRIVG